MAEKLQLNMENLIAQSQKKRRGKILPPPFVPYDWQAPIIKKMLDQILKGKSGLVIQPTATGKSTEAAFLARICTLLHGKRGLYLYSENEGLDQAGKNFRKVFGENDATFANLFGGKKDSLGEADIVFASFQSLNNHKKKLYKTFPKNFFDFKIINEAHHSEATTYKEVIEYFECPHIGMTGTPDRMDGKDIRNLYEEVLFEMLLEEAIALGRVAKIEYHIMSHGLSTQRLKKICKEVLEEGKRISIKQLNESIFVEMLEEETRKEIYRYALPIDRKPLQALVYCENTIHADRVYESFKKDGVKVERIHSKLSKSHNKDVMQAFRGGKIQFLVSVNKLNEDIDVPNVELIALLRATDSYNIWAQQIGRGLRKVKGKNKLIVLDFVANAERLILMQEIMRRIEKFAAEYIMQNDLQKNLLHVSGEGFDFFFTDKVVNMLKVIEAIRLGWYQTWQEAKNALLKYGFTGRRDYQKRYYQCDPRLPSNPNVVYPDFPGYPEFLGLEAHSGWKNVTGICKILSGYDVKRTNIYSFLKKYKAKKQHYKDLIFLQRKSPHFSPALTRLTIYHFKKKYFFISNGWKSIGDLEKEGVGGRAAIKSFVDIHEKNHLCVNLWNAGYFTKYYEPKFIEIIRVEFANRLINDDWVPISMFTLEKLTSLPSVRKFVDYFSKNHFGITKKVSFGLTLVHEYVNPAMARLMRYYFSKKKKSNLEGWAHIHELVRQGVASRKAIAYFVRSYRSVKPDWFQNFWRNGRSIEHFSPKLIKKIKAHFAKKKTK